MKTLTKWLALLLAGLMLTATLLACDSGSNWDDDDDDDDEESESFDRYKKLTPDEVWEALLEADDYTVAFHAVATEANGTTELQATIEKDCEKVKIVDIQNENGEATEELSYCDLEKHTIYKQSFDDSWQVRQNEKYTIEYILLNTRMNTKAMLDSDLYGEYDPDTRSYPFIPEKYRESIEIPEDMIISGSLTVKGTTYTVMLESELNSQKSIIELEIAFEAVTVKFPDEIAPDEDQPSIKPSPEQTRTEKPVVTDDQPIVTPPEDEPLPEYNPYSVLWSDLQDAPYCTALMTCSDGDTTVAYVLVKKLGDLLQIEFISPEEDYNIIVDLSTQMFYTHQLWDGVSYWVYEDFDQYVTWEDLLNGVVYEQFWPLFAEDSYYWEYESGRHYWYFGYQGMNFLSDSMDTNVLGVNIFEEDGEYRFIIGHEDFGTEYTTDLSLSLSTEYFEIPDNTISEEDFEQMTENEPSFDPSAYYDLAPDQIYDALLHSKELYMLIRMNDDQTEIRKTGDLLEIAVYDPETEMWNWSYVDLSTQTLYRMISFNQYTAEDFPYTWEECIDSFGIVPDSYIFNNNSYESFDEYDTELEVDPSMVPYDIRFATLNRSWATYEFEELTKDGDYSVLTIRFENQDVELPF